MFAGTAFSPLGWRSESERPPTRLIGLTPLELFSSVLAVRRSQLVGSGPYGRETTSGKVRCSDYRKRSRRVCGGDPGGRTWPENSCRGEGSLPGRDLFTRGLHSDQGAAASRRGLRSVQEWRGAGVRGQRAENQLGQRPGAEGQDRQEAFERHRVSLQKEPRGVGAGLGKV